MRKLESSGQISFDPNSGLAPAIVQDAQSNRVLMLGYMNEQALEKTWATQKVTFFSRSKQRLWTKGEISGNYLKLVEIWIDCDQDALLVKVIPQGPTCHTGTDTCWAEKNEVSVLFLDYLSKVIRDRRKESPEASYTAKLFHKGINKIAQKVGEEAVELVIEAKDDDKERFRNEAADLLFHYLLLLEAKNCTLTDIISVLKKRHK